MVIQKQRIKITLGSGKQREVNGFRYNDFIYVTEKTMGIDSVWQLTHKPTGRLIFQSTFMTPTLGLMFAERIWRRLTSKEKEKWKSTNWEIVSDVRDEFKEWISSARNTK